MSTRLNTRNLDRDFAEVEGYVYRIISSHSGLVMCQSLASHKHFLWGQALGQPLKFLIWLHAELSSRNLGDNQFNSCFTINFVFFLYSVTIFIFSVSVQRHGVIVLSLQKEEVSCCHSNFSAPTSLRFLYASK